MNQPSLPGGPEEITPEWLTIVFREKTILTSGAVVGVQTDRIAQDRGFTGVIARVRLQYAGREEAAPSSVVVKLPTALRSTPSAYRASQEKESTAAPRSFERCAREVAFYQQVAPLSALPVPRLYYGAADSASGRVTLVLEDLHTARTGDALGGCSPQDASLVIEQLAHFHAQWWDLSTAGDVLLAPMVGRRFANCPEPLRPMRRPLSPAFWIASAKEGARGH